MVAASLVGMRSRTIVLSLLGILFVVAQSFDCGRRRGLNCNPSATDTALLGVNLSSNMATVKLLDTIWFSSTVSDTIYNRAGTDRIVNAFEQMLLVVQPYTIIRNGTLSQLAYANIEFNPVVKDGVFANNSYYPGFQFQFRRNKPFNYLQAGLVAGKPGLYAIVLNHNNYIGNNNFYITPANNYCKQFIVNSSINASQQNQQYWDTLQVSSLPLQNSNGSTIITRNNTHYVLIKVVP